MSRHPEDVRTLVAHEPPLASVLPDREHALAATRAVHETHQRSGWGAGMAHVIVVVSHQGPFTAEIAGQPAPDPARFGTKPEMFPSDHGGLPRRRVRPDRRPGRLRGKVREVLAARA